MDENKKKKRKPNLVFRKNKDYYRTICSDTEREKEVFYQLVFTEDSIQKIADKLYISKRTLKDIFHLYMKNRNEIPGWID